MIVAKTGMGRMPGNCDECSLFSHDLPYPDKCAVKDKIVNAHKGRPSWCPLQEVFTTKPVGKQLLVSETEKEKEESLRIYKQYQKEFRETIGNK